MPAPTARKPVRSASAAKQGGAVLLILALLLVLGVSWFGLRLLNSARPGNAAAVTSLIDARDAILGSTAAATAEYNLIQTVNSPGRLPPPDMLDPTTGPPNVYDGASNIACARSTWAFGATLATLGGPAGIGPNMRCFGRLPWASLGMGSFAAIPTNDPLGQVPWYAISANLTDSCVRALNPAILDTNFATFATGNCRNVLPPFRPFPWLTVRDPKGNLITDRAAFVLILPGPPVAGQTRPSSPMQGPAAFLDSVTVAPTCAQPCVPGTYDNARFNWPDSVGLSFIQCAPPGGQPSTDPSFAQPYNCNDKLVYVTIDELMGIAERRSMEYAADLLRAYYAKNFHFPYAAPLSQVTVGLRGQCENGTARGLLPVVATTSSVAPLNPNPCPHPEFATDVASWFQTENKWGDYIIYALAADCSQATPGTTANCGGGTGIRLTAGTAARALVISAGAAIQQPPFAVSINAAQVRPSPNLNNYLDSIENTDGDTRYDPPSSLLSRSYNDKTVVVAP